MSFATSAAALLVEYGRPVEVSELEVPDPEPTAVIVEVLATTMCGTDVHIHAGDFDGGASHLPVLLGHEIIGRVVAIGSAGRWDVAGGRVRVGDRIAWSYAWCGECYWCAIAKQPTLCARARQYGWGPADVFPFVTGGYSRYAYVMPACRIVRVPDALPDAVAASLTCAFRTVVHAFERAGGVEPLDRVLVQGSGAVGLYALAYALGSGAREVAVIGAPRRRLDIATSWGAVETLDLESSSAQERAEWVREWTDGRGADLVVEAAGSRFAVEEGLGLVRRGGRYLVVGQTDPVPAQIPATRINLDQITLVGSVSADVSHYWRAFDFAVTHADRFDFSALLGSEYGLNEVDDALSAIRSGAEIKPVIVPGRSAVHADPAGGSE